MKLTELLFVLMICMLPIDVVSQNLPFKQGEFLKYRIHYGLLNAGFAELEVKANPANSDEFHVVGTGYTSGMVRFFFKVDDRYETFFDKRSLAPSKAIRRVDEGGYTIKRDLFFEQQKAVITKDLKKNRIDTTAVDRVVYDLVAAFYKLRTTDMSKFKAGDEIPLDLFFDREIYPFKMKVLGRESVRVKNKKIPALILRPLVMSGRVFEAEESVTIWVSDDSNKIPLRIKASLAVGSLKADLVESKSLQH